MDTTNSLEMVTPFKDTCQVFAGYFACAKLSLLIVGRGLLRQTERYFRKIGNPINQPDVKSGKKNVSPKNRLRKQRKTYVMPIGSMYGIYYTYVMYM